LALIVIFPELQEEEERKAADKANRALITANKIKFLRQTINNFCKLIIVLYYIFNIVTVKSISKPEFQNKLKETNEPL